MYVINKEFQRSVAEYNRSIKLARPAYCSRSCSVTGGNRKSPIDSSKGYIKGNIRFISVMANYAKNNFPDSDLLKFCQAVVDNQAS